MILLLLCAQNPRARSVERNLDAPAPPVVEPRDLTAEASNQARLSESQSLLGSPSRSKDHSSALAAVGLLPLPLGGSGLDMVTVGFLGVVMFRVVSDVFAVMVLLCGGDLKESEKEGEANEDGSLHVCVFSCSAVRYGAVAGRVGLRVGKDWIGRNVVCTCPECRFDGI